MIGVLLSALIGARALYVLLNWEEYQTRLADIVATWKDAGLSFHGAAAGAVLAVYLICKRWQVPFLAVADAAAPAVAIGHSIGRIGCFLNGCCHGEATSLFLGVRFHNPEIGIFTPPSHPTQLYEAGLLVIVFLLLVRFQSRASYQGALFVGWLAGYSLIRFFVDFFRTYGPGASFFGIVHSQWLSAALIGLSAALHRMWSRSSQRQQGGGGKTNGAGRGRAN